jgi:phosphatidylglycerophosphatase A
MERPTWRFLLAHPSHLIACGLGSGLSPWAPGTAGTLFAWASFLLIRPRLSDGAFLAFLALAFAFGVFACDRTGRALGVPDHGSIVWDEIVPFWLVLLMSPPSLPWQGIAFLLFRAFDIFKPPPADWIDARMKTGLGVMLDDVVAAGYTVLVLALLVRIAG